ncbi:similar to Saccharomyces cerevisiae YBR176W ECM31 Ketopantoate hydroxymethyltransferase, required for pantothenic acid biosynthesis, converts 2-oxoisovalerate into 2-dehydropantoate [Maudiozyma saulgeensis]|uniref:3-methyl-2-oxobutanoate hydroxymethyltransferase n=1 Tax=Maudiozyma saulgeensis TaxID=1789683 RepID=A0A1X7R235_9SACH|nr:similar to Saccharomyces cerevisiae YBR176W ECM31 Ketopantoate hydroxymethyltransferase, required for pantothenic acid biosynthesis, converts 2-oxoisovalerate into 2-dehydropantoate [Kazachstania saulgeensis]
MFGLKKYTFGNKPLTRFFKQRYSSHPVNNNVRSLTIADIKDKYMNGMPLTMITAYDYLTAKWVQETQSDMLLVGDSMAMTSLGYTSTTELPFEEFKYHVASVTRASGSSMIVVDMPFGSFEQSYSYGVANAIELLKINPKVTSLKIECGNHDRDHYTIGFIRELCERGIPVMSHIGLTPQRANSLGGFKVQGNQSANDILSLYNTAKYLQKIGCWSILMECIPYKVATFITENLNIPTIGIGAGNGTNGQVLVISDMLGLSPDNNLQSLPRFVKNYDQLNSVAIKNLKIYKDEVEQKKFPSIEHSFKLKETIWKDFLDLIK